MLRKIRNTLLDDSIEWHFNWLPEGWFGLYEGDKITISPSCLIPTIIHECLHNIDSKLSEAKVERLSYQIYHQLTQRQRKNLILAFFWRTNHVKKEKKKDDQSKKGVSGKGRIHQPAPHKGSLKRR